VATFSEKSVGAGNNQANSSYKFVMLIFAQ
jgi:hypothetical protein